MPYGTAGVPLACSDYEVSRSSARNFSEDHKSDNNTQHSSLDSVQAVHASCVAILILATAQRYYNLRRSWRQHHIALAISDILSSQYPPASAAAAGFDAKLPNGELKLKRELECSITSTDVAVIAVILTGCSTS